MPNAPAGHNWQSLMRLALAEAKKALKWGDVPVGALVVLSSGEIVGTGYNRVEQDKNPAAHAEIAALGAAAKSMDSPRLPGAILVSTLEPCLMCAGAIAHARISGVVYGAADPGAGAIQSAADMETLPLAGRVFWHMGGILGKECAALLNNFFKSLRQQTTL